MWLSLSNVHFRCGETSSFHLKTKLLKGLSSITILRSKEKTERQNFPPHSQKEVGAVATFPYKAHTCVTSLLGFLSNLNKMATTSFEGEGLKLQP